MIAFPTLLSGVILFALLMVPGYILGKCNKIENGALVSMTNILMYVAMPFLVFSKLLETDIRAIPMTDILLCVLFPIAVILTVYFVSVLIFRKKDGDTRYRASRFCSIIPNCGFLGIPLAEVLFPEHPEVAVYVSLFNVVSTFLLLTFGVYILSGDRQDISFRRAVFSPIMASIVLGVIFSLAGWADAVPQIGTYAGYLAALTTPLSMLVLGVQFSKIRFSALVKTPSFYPVAALKLLAMPILTVLVLIILRWFGLEIGSSLSAALFLSTAVSSAASSSAMAKKYGVDGEYAAVLTLGTTLLCVFTLPLLYMLSDLILFSR